jgi:hypothetical protein
MAENAKNWTVIPHKDFKPWLLGLRPDLKMRVRIALLTMQEAQDKPFNLQLENTKTAKAVDGVHAKWRLRIIDGDSGVGVLYTVVRRYIVLLGCGLAEELILSPALSSADKVLEAFLKENPYV